MYKIEVSEMDIHCDNKTGRDTYKDINFIKKGCQPTEQFIKDENGEILANSNRSGTQVDNLLQSLQNTQTAGEFRA
jgi:hypothetical protein